MAITSTEIHNQSFSIDRKGYDVDEVDVFLEHVAEEIDTLNAQISYLEDQAEGSKFDGLDTPARIEEEPSSAAVAADATVAELNEAIAERDERIAELERQLEEKQADGNAIAQALIIAQRSADEILARSNNQAAETIQDAKDEAQRILDRANADKQDVIDAIRKLEDDREDAREEYQELLQDFIADATRKLVEIGGVAQAPVPSAHARNDFAEASPAATDRFAAQVPINVEGSVSYATPQTGAVAVAAATPQPMAVEKDLSGFGDTDDDFEFDELD